jgi:peptidoglycan/xylan/chitin deacetylase (PgdA/CDA1 family)
MKKSNAFYGNKIFCLPILMIIFVSSFLLFTTGCENAKKEKKENIIVRTDTLIPLKQNDTSIHIYLTFDDGPYFTTLGLANTLIKENVKSSFFVIGSQITASTYYDSVFRTIKQNSLFKTYNHTFSHAITHGKIKKYYKYPVNVWNDIQKNKQYLDVGCNITRLPGINAWRFQDSNKCYSNKSARLLFKYLDSIHSKEKILGWDFEWTGKESKNISNVEHFFEKITDRIKNDKSKNKSYVILLHDYLFKNESALNNLSFFISLLKINENNEFKWANEYPGIQ